VNTNFTISKEILKNFNLEVISIFLIFYSILENSKIDLKTFTKLVELLTTNNYLYINLLKNSFSRI